MKNVGADGATGFHRIKNKNQEVKKKLVETSQSDIYNGSYTSLGSF